MFEVDRQIIDIFIHRHSIGKFDEHSPDSENLILDLISVHLFSLLNGTEVYHYVFSPIDPIFYPSLIFLYRSQSVGVF